MVVSSLTQIVPRNVLKQVLVTTSCNLYCIGVGSTIGFSSVLLPQLKHDETFSYHETLDASIASSTCLAMAVGCIIGGILSDRYGRRFTHLVLTIPFLIGWIVLSFANDIILMILGRVVTGMCTGAYRSLGAVYLGEITNPTMRPFFIFTLSISGTSGILFGHIVGGYLNWRLACYIICIPIALAFILQLFSKESPLWLIYKGKIDQGSEGFIWFRGDNERSQIELSENVEKHKNRSQDITLKEKIDSVFSTSFMKPLLTAVLLFTSMQFTGVNTISFYAQDLMKDTFNQDPFVLMLVTDAVRVIGIAMLFTFSKYFPRRKSYTVICFIANLLLLAVVAYIGVRPNGLGWLAIVIFMLYMALASIICGLSWTFIAEIFPSNLRGLGSGIGVSVSFLLLFLTVVITPIILRDYGIMATYATFAAISLFALLFLYVLLPQSDGKTLHEIENSYSKK